MKAARRYWRRLCFLASRRKREAELEDELAFHREMMEREGRAAAILGSPLRLREDTREAWGWGWLDRLAQDVSFGVRLLRRSPGFTAAAVLVLAFGLGVNFAAFHIFNAGFLRPLAIRAPENYFRFERQSPSSHSTGVPCPAVQFYRDNNHAIGSFFGVAGESMSVDGNTADLIYTAFISGNYFSELGAGAAYGRLLAPSDEAPSAQPVVVLSHAYWQRRFGGDPAAVGRTIRLNGKPVTIAGVAAHDFVFGDKTNAWLAMPQHPYFIEGSKRLRDYESNACNLYGYLNPGQSPEAARDALRPLVEEYNRQRDTNIAWEDEYLQPRPAGYAVEWDTKETGPVVLAIGALMLLILLSACANLGNMLLARAVAREREISIRLAVGAGRARLVRQLLTEGLILSALGAGIAILLSYWAAVLFLKLTEAPLRLQPGYDVRVFAAALGLTLLATMAFSLTPALAAVRRSQRNLSVRKALIAAQVATGCVLVIVGSLLARSAQHILREDPGCDPSHVVAIDVNLARHGFNPGTATQRLEDIKARLTALPGVEAVAAESMLPFGTRMSTTTYKNPNITTIAYSVEPRYFETLRIPIRRGRTFLPNEANVIVVSESLAARVWPGQDPIGRLFPLDDGQAAGTASTGLGPGAPAPIPRGKMIVVGVVGDTTAWKAKYPDFYEMYRPPNRYIGQNAIIAVRLSGDPATRVADLRAAVAVPPLVPQLELMRTWVEQRAQRARLGAAIVGTLAGLSLLLAAVGIFGLIAYTVAQRTKEIGIRMALGASRPDVVRSVTAHYRLPLAAGATVGIVLAVAVSQLLRAQLGGISPLDPVAHAGSLLVFGFTAVLATWWPARRALQVDPSTALRWE